MFSSLRKIAPVCTDCTILYGNLKLEYEDGRHASIDSQTYLHHSQIFNNGKGRHYLGCPNKPMKVGPGNWMGGGSDDLSIWYTNQNGSYNSGMYLAPTDKFSLLTEIMNYSRERKQLYVSMEAEYLRGPQNGFLDIRNPIISVRDCTAPSFYLTNPVSNFTSQPWTSPWSGKLVYAGKFNDHASPST
jgi:hypothetical protein